MAWVLQPTNDAYNPKEVHSAPEMVHKEAHFDLTLPSDHVVGTCTVEVKLAAPFEMHTQRTDLCVVLEAVHPDGTTLRLGSALVDDVLTPRATTGTVEVTNTLCITRQCRRVRVSLESVTAVKHFPRPPAALPGSSSSHDHPTVGSGKTTLLDFQGKGITMFVFSDQIHE